MKQKKFRLQPSARGRYQLATISNVSREVHFIEFESIGEGKTFLAIDGSGIELIDQGTLKIIRAGDGTKLLFIEYPDGELRCASIKHANGCQSELVVCSKWIGATWRSGFVRPNYQIQL